jgi:hypothetical protein
MLALQALEIAFGGVLIAMTAAVGLISLTVVVRVVEPKGVRALAERVIGREIRLPRRRTT